MAYAPVRINRGEERDAGNEARHLIDPQVGTGEGTGSWRERFDRSHLWSRWIDNDRARHLLVGVAPAVADVRRRLTFRREEPKLVTAKRIGPPPGKYLVDRNAGESALSGVTGP